MSYKFSYPKCRKVCDLKPFIFQGIKTEKRSSFHNFREEWLNIKAHLIFFSYIGHDIKKKTQKGKTKKTQNSKVKTKNLYPVL